MPIYVPGKLNLAKGFTPESYMYEFPSQYPIWSPARITTALWLDAADVSTLAAGSGGGVSQWNDKSGNSRHATQSTQSQQPLLDATGLNSKPSINFDGSNDYLELPTGLLNGSTAVSVAFVLLGPSQANDAIFGPKFTNSTGLELVWTAVANFPTLLRINGVNKITTGLWSTNSQPTITTFQADASATAGWLNGTTVSAVSSTGIASLSYNGIYAIGTYALGSGGAYGQMNLAELLISSSAWSASDRQKVEGYLAHKWGLTANLPSDHPYKTVGPTL